MDRGAGRHRGHRAATGHRRVGFGLRAARRGAGGRRRGTIEGSRARVGRFVALAAVLPSASSSLGVDGGVIFQILAVEELGLSPAAIGTALGLGVLSIPLQLWAARLTLSVAPRNLRLFLAMMAAGCWGLAALIAVAEPGAALGVTALGITILAELAVSVLFATSWQPLMSRLLTTRTRQQVNARGRAVGGGVLVLVVLAFGAVGTPGRVVILGAVGAAVVMVLLLLRDLPVPAPAPSDGEPSAPPAPLPAVTVPLLVLAGFGAASSWPLFPVYAAEVLWPGVDLGIVGGVQTGSALAAAFLWRSTEGRLLPRAGAAVAVLVLATLAFVLLPYVGTSSALGTATLVLLGVAVAARSVLLMTMLELIHRTLSERTSVRVLTVLDVVASTSLQAGLFLGGLLITLSSRISWGAADPYQIYVLVAAVGAAGAVGWVRHRVGSASDL